MSYTTDDLLSIIKKRAFIPVAQETFLDQDLLDMATDEMHSLIVPAVLSASQEWYVTPLVTPVTQSTTEIDIPSRAIGGSLREVSFAIGDQERNLARLDLEDRQYSTNQGPINGFYIQGNQLKLMGSQEGSVIQYFHARPGKLVPATGCPKVVSVDVDNSLITLDSVPATWATGDIIDVIKASPHFEYRNISLTVTNIAGSVLTVAETLSSKITANDWVSLEDTSPVPQIPVEWFQYLAQAVVTQVLTSQGDLEAAKLSYSKSQQLRTAALSLMAPRVFGETKKAVSPKNRGFSGARTRGW